MATSHGAQQWTPTTVLAGSAAMALDSRSTASSAGIGKPGDIRSANHGSSRRTSCGDEGNAALTNELSSTRRARTVAVAWANASVDDSPLFISSTPSVTGPDELPLDRRAVVADAGRQIDELPQPGETVTVERLGRLGDHRFVG